MRRRRGGCGCLRGILLVPLIFVVGYALDQALNAFIFAPWAYGVLGRQTLTGDWNGTLRAHSGVSYAVHLELNRSSQALTGRLAPDIDGHVSWCTRSGGSTTSTLSGTSDRSASDVTLYVQEPPHPRPGLRPSRLQGAWHGTTLLLNVLFLFYDGHAYVMSNSFPDEHNAVSLTLHKSGYAVYRDACARL